MTEYEFLDEIPMDRGHTLDQQTARFQSVKDGLPELVKNSKDQYARLGVLDKDDRQIVVIASSQQGLIAVLDFAGAAAEDFDGWVTWSSRTANRAHQAHDIEGGFGNGGKSFMVRGSRVESFMESCANDLRTKMGFQNDRPDKRYYPAFAREAGRRVKDIAESKPRARLDALLRAINLRFNDLPAAARHVFETRLAFTVVRVDGIADWDGRRPGTVRDLIGHIPDDLIHHAQAALTLETSSVWIIADGYLLNGQALLPDTPVPMPGFEDLPSISVPPELPDPATEEMVNTGRGDASSKRLELYACNEQLRMSDRRKALNVVRIKNERNIIGNWSIADLVPRAESAFIYGSLRIPDLTAEHQDGATRRELSDTALARALKAWVVEQVDGLATRIQQARARHHRQEDRELLQMFLNSLRAMMPAHLGRRSTKKRSTGVRCPRTPVD